MFNIRARLGDILVVTLIANERRPGGIQAEERVNGRRIFRLWDDKKGKHGDRARVKIINENRASTLYHFQVVEILEEGDGDSTVFQKVRAVIDCQTGRFTYDPYGTRKGLAIAQEHFGQDDRMHLEFLINLAESYAKEVKDAPCNLNWLQLVAIVDRLLTRIPADCSIDKSGIYKRLSELCQMFPNNEARTHGLCVKAQDLRK